MTIELKDDFERARELTQNNEYSQAIDLYEKILVAYPQHVPSHFNLGQLQAAFLGDFIKARSHFEQALSLEPHFAPGYFQLAQILLVDQQLKEAMAHLQTAIALDPEYIDALHLLACTAMQQQDFELAQEHFEQLMQLSPEHASCRLNYALLKLQQQRSEEAKLLLDSALSLDPTLVEAHYHRGVIAMQQGDNERALLEMQETLDRQADHFAALYNLAILYKMQHQYQLATHFLKKAQAIKPEDESIRYLLAAFSQQDTLAQAPQPYVKELFNHYAEKYDEHMHQGLHYQTPNLLWELLKEQQLIFPKQALVLDLGCGTGLSAQAFQDLQATFIGVDLAEKMLAKAKERGIYHELHEMDLVTYLKDASNKFDLIIAADVLNYFGPLEEIFNLCENVLNEKGLFLFSIELAKEKDLQLHQDARFAHSEDYIVRLTKNWQLLAKKTITLRYQEHCPVQGEIFLYHPLIRPNGHLLPPGEGSPSLFSLDPLLPSVEGSPSLFSLDPLLPSVEGAR